MTSRKAFWQGVGRSLPFLLVVAPFSTLFGVVATDAGLSLAQAMGFSVLVIAGAAQFAALQMMVENAPIVMVLLASLAVNLRMAMYSASLVPYLGKAPLWQRALVAYLNFDQSYAVGVARFEDDPDMPVPARVAFIVGIALPIAFVWCVMSLVGILLGAAIPASFGLDFALPIAFLALIAPMLRTAAHLVAALVSIVAALLLAGMPSGVGLLVAAGLAMCAGAGFETWMERRGA